MAGQNIEITHDEIEAIRGFDDFDMKMFLSELEEFGWNDARALIPMIVQAQCGNKAGRPM